MQNPIPKLRQTSLISKKPGFLSENLKTLTGLVLFRSWVINKSVKSECVETSSFLIFGNNSTSKQIFKNATHTLL